MSGFKRGTAARLLVQVTSEIALDRHCQHCKLQRRFVSSGKFRVNAQKKRIDAWLIFRCSTCDDRWNWPVHERRPVGALDPTELNALMQNDPALAIRHGEAAIRKFGNGGAGNAPAARLTVQDPATAGTRTIEIILAVAGAGPRLDRLLAQVLGLGRRNVEAMAEAGALTIRPAVRKALRRNALDGQRIRIDLEACAGETAVALRRRLEAQAPDLYCATLSPR